MCERSDISFFEVLQKIFHIVSTPPTTAIISSEGFYMSKSFTSNPLFVKGQVKNTRPG
jgi:hypothetical protein